MKNYYKILEVNKTASQDVIAKVYKFLAKKYHPDANPTNKEMAEETFKQISEAYEILSNPEKRQQYDIELEEYEKNLLETPKLQELRNYCAELEQQIHTLKSRNVEAAQYSNNSQRQNLDFEKAQRQAQAEAVQRAYDDAYVHTLKGMGYKIRYKQSFKQKCKNFLSLLLAIVLTIIVLKVLLKVPAVQKFLQPIYDIIEIFK